MPATRKILVIDDEPDVLSVLEVRLKKAGYEVVTACDGKEALNKMQQSVPDLIITDVLMPEMDGFALYKQLKKSKLFEHIPVLVLTARGQMEDTFKVVGVDDFLTKPFDAQELLEKVVLLISRAEMALSPKTDKRILVAGMDDEVVKNMIVQLKKAGIHTDFVLSGAQVISRAVLFLPQILIMDVMMEGMESGDIVRVLRQMSQFDKIPILGYSYYRISDLGSEDVRQRALSVDSSQVLCMENGATEYIGRFNENTFLRSVGKYF